MTTAKVLIVGVGAVGGFTAQHLAAMEIGPMRLLDRDLLDDKNIMRHPLGREYIGKSKALSLEHRLQWDFRQRKVKGIHADFLKLSVGEQIRLIGDADLVIAATDTYECQRRINEVCFEAEVTAVYPGIWVHAATRSAEVGEVMWVLSGRNSPCYECATSSRNMEEGARAWRGTRADVELLAIVTAQLAAALLEQGEDAAEILDYKRTLTLVHGFTPTSPGIRRVFPTEGLRSINIEVPVDDLCQVCGRDEWPDPAEDEWDPGDEWQEPVQTEWQGTVPDGPTRPAPRPRVADLDLAGLYKAAAELVETPLYPSLNRSDFKRLRELRKQAVEISNEIILRQYATQGITIDQSMTQPTVSRLCAIADDCERMMTELR